MSALVIANLVGLAAQALLYIVWLAGIVYALVRWQRHPRASLLMVVGLVLVAIVQTAGLALNLLAPNLLNARAVPARSISVLLAVANGVRSLANAVVFGLLLAAVFVERPPIDEERPA